MSMRGGKRERALKLRCESLARRNIICAIFGRGAATLRVGTRSSQFSRAFYRALLHVESIAIARASFRGRISALNARGMKLRCTVARAFPPADGPPPLFPRHYFALDRGFLASPPTSSLEREPPSIPLTRPRWLATVTVDDALDTLPTYNSVTTEFRLANRVCELSTSAE